MNGRSRSGIELLDEITRSGNDTPVMILTETDKAQAAIEALHRGASACLMKPLRREELLSHMPVRASGGNCGSSIVDYVSRGWRSKGPRADPGLFAAPMRRPC